MGTEAMFPPAGQVYAYVDGSYNHAILTYAFGCVFLTPEEKIYTTFGNGNQPESLKQRNVSGEMLGAMYAVRAAMASGYEAVTLFYDYEGIEKWVSGAWKSKNDLTKKYAAAMRDWGGRIQISFVKVPAHSKVTFNELADEKAREGLTKAKGVPKIVPVWEMEEYQG